jgi:predicted DNA-binding transcriptional regulator AlpA
MSTRQKDKTPVERMTNQTKFNLDDEWVTPEFLEEKFGKSKSYWYDLRRDELGPEFLSLGHRSILYRLASVEEWLKTLVVKSLSDPKYREMREMRRLKRQERLQRQQAKTEKRSLAPKTPKPDRNAPLLSWADVRLQRLRKPQFLLTQGERGAASQGVV